MENCWGTLAVGLWTRARGLVVWGWRSPLPCGALTPCSGQDTGGSACGCTARGVSQGPGAPEGPRGSRTVCLWGPEPEGLSSLRARDIPGAAVSCSDFIKQELKAATRK